ncbi:MAG: polyprenyl diphosphate synthase [Planctomycetia bacterium]|nr:polyprenyl diphosphate synthase [Planctomycetia bacterium]
MTKDLSLPLPLPLRHIAIIMDGNGRWARSQGKIRSEGHRRGAETVREIVTESVKLGLEQLTLYCFSSENWKRPESELQALMFLLEHFMISERELMIRQNVRLKIIGRKEGIPASAIKEMELSQEITSQNTGLTLCLAINYGSRQEIVDAVRNIARRVVNGEITAAEIDQKITESYFSESLYTAGMPDPDLLIRTAGELRLSNYLLWQLSYAEIWVTECCWPEFNISLFHQAITDYAQRTRRFGAVVE